MLALLLSTIPFFDFFLTKIIGKKARWFQLHAIINIIICILISKQSINLLLSPTLPLIEYSKNDIMALQLVLGLHTYHIFIETLTFIEWWHHICFVAFGVLPVLLVTLIDLTIKVSFDAAVKSDVSLEVARATPLNLYELAIILIR